MHEPPAPFPPPTAPSSQGFIAMLYRLTPHAVVTGLLLAANVAVWGWMVARGVDWMWPGPLDLLAWGANSGPQTLGGEWWRLLASLFLHGGVIHLAANMWGLYALGPLTERLVGPVGFLLLYAISGVAGNLASLYWNPEGLISVGASGAVFGVLGALLGSVLPRWRSVPRGLFFGVLFTGVSAIAATAFIAILVPLIDNAAHMGGLAAGVVCGLVLSQPLTPQTPRRRAVRNAVLAVLGAAALFAAFRSLPTARFTFQREFERFTDVQSEVFDEYRRAQELHAIGRIGDDQLADAITDRIVPPWRASRERLEALPQPAPQAERFRQLVIETLRLREEAWELEARGLRADDRRLLDRAKQKRAAANALVRKIEQLPE